jgi:undecaprenyl-diphosphatase
VALTDLAGEPAMAQTLPSLVIGLLAAGMIGFIAIRWLLRYLAGGSLRGFAVYCALAGAAGLLVSLIRG